MRHAFFTVDLEDFSHDLCRQHGSLLRPALRKYELEDSYDNVSNLISRFQKNSKITFFCTGIMARDYPHLIKRISDDGHEIACHSYYHDHVNKTNPKDLRENILRAKGCLEDITKQEVCGFRAPRFSIEKDDYVRLEVISKIFNYDSSLHFSSKAEFLTWRRKIPFDINEFPVASQPQFGGLFNVKLGGSYFKLFPYRLMRAAAVKSHFNEITPIFYLHPYDFCSGGRFLATWNELKGLSASKRLYWFLRQYQYGVVPNWVIDRKLIALFRDFDNLGPIKSSFAMGL